MDRTTKMCLPSFVTFFVLILIHEASMSVSQEDWVVCRVFQKSSTTGKRIQLTPTSLHPSLESPYEATTLMNEQGEIELVNSSSCFDAISANNINNNSNNYNGNSIDTNMNWVSAREAINHPSVSQPSSLLSSNFLTNSMIFRALQSGVYQPREATISDLSSFPAQGNSRFITDLNSNFAASSAARIMDSVQQEQFNLDSIW